MVAENYSESRRAMAKKIGLGRKPGARKADAEQRRAAAPAPQGPQRKAAQPVAENA